MLKQSYCQVHKRIRTPPTKQFPLTAFDDLGCRAGAEAEMASFDHIWYIIWFIIWSYLIYRLSEFIRSRWYPEHRSHHDRTTWEQAEVQAATAALSKRLSEFPEFPVLAGAERSQFTKPLRGSIKYQLWMKIAKQRHSSTSSPWSLILFVRDVSRQWCTSTISSISAMHITDTQSKRLTKGNHQC